MTASAYAGTLERACRASDRTEVDPALCRCIQHVADGMLSPPEQRRAARFFADPHLSQELRQSDRPGDERFWERYKTFGAAAAARCVRQV
ncbi:hypothetical protein DDZ14_12490 [Maritimibacter sp. 55A14]|nr:hypothetical protein DDZ14_12490 [Maritimibacter sp. 55A14]